MQPILKQTKTRPSSIRPKTTDIFMDSYAKPKSCPFSPLSSGNNQTMKNFNDYSQSKVSSKSSVYLFSGSKNNYVYEPTATAFDNADICDIDRQLSLSVKVLVEAPSIVRKPQHHHGLYNSNQSSQMKPSIENQLSSTQSTVNTPSTSNVRPGSRQRNTSICDTDTISSLSKKRSGILHR
jgi:hypothetical protein